MLRQEFRSCPRPVAGVGVSVVAQHSHDGSWRRAEGLPTSTQDATSEVLLASLRTAVADAVHFNRADSLGSNNRAAILRGYRVR